MAITMCNLQSKQNEIKFVGFKKNSRIKKEFAIKLMTTYVAHVDDVQFKDDGWHFSWAIGTRDFF